MCSADGCEKPNRPGRSGLCEMHYMRMYRNGTLDKKITAKAFEHSGGYILIPARNHPLAKGDSHHYEHRIVYFDANGVGPFECHWCSKEVTWETLHIDHLDDDKKNNALANLVASCPVCNQARGQYKIQNTWRKKTGLTALGETLTMNEWAEKIGVSRQSLIWRLKNGWTLEKALTEGPGKTGPKKKATIR